MVLLEDPVGNRFTLSYYYIQGEYRLGAGFFGLRLAHHIQTSVQIHFLYRGDARFNIRIYDAFRREINYMNFYPIPPQVIPNNVDPESSDSDSDEEVHPVPWMEKIWQSNITAAHILRNEPMVCLMCEFVISYCYVIINLIEYSFLYFFFVDYFTRNTKAIFP